MPSNLKFLKLLFVFGKYHSLVSFEFGLLNTHSLPVLKLKYTMVGIAFLRLPRAIYP